MECNGDTRLGLLSTALAMCLMLGAAPVLADAPKMLQGPSQSHAPAAAAQAAAAAAAAAHKLASNTSAPLAASPNATVTVDLARLQPTSPMLYGIFFEEIGHAGDGGLYGELVQDRSFDALAQASGFKQAPPGQQPSSPDTANPGAAAAGPLRLSISLADLAAAAEQAQQAQHVCHSSTGSGDDGGRAAAAACGCSGGGCRRRKERGSEGNDIVIAWQALPGTVTTLTRELPLNAHNLVAMELTSAGGVGAPAGILNTGYWGVPVEAGVPLSLSLYLSAPTGAPANATVVLLGSHGNHSSGASSAETLAAASFTGLTPQWQRFTAELESGTADNQAQLGVLFDGPGVLVVDSVSLFPSTNAARGAAEGLVNPWPFRPDLLGALKALQPKFLRFPGGCYVEGDWLAGAFRSTDGLGLFEYLLLAEELGAAPIWVVNNGIAHNDQVPTRDIWPWVQEALDGIEFISGPPNSTWGRVRAAMGRPQPWRLDYLGIGNEGCGLPWDRPNPDYRPFYWKNYLAFYGAIKAAHPHLTLIANCHLGDLAPTDVWEYHVYTNPDDMFSRRTAFDGLTPQAPGGLVFASEYAVTDGGGHGNVIGAVAEAGFMLGMERTPQVVLAGSYAPLLVNANAVPWVTNMLWFDNNRLYGIPSYHVQRMLAAHLGTQNIETAVVGRDGTLADTLAAAASCLNAPCDEVAVKLVNFSPAHHLVSLRFQGLARGALRATGDLLTLGSNDPLEENSFGQPTKVAPRSAVVSGVAERFDLLLQPWSLSILKLRIVPPSA